MIVGIAYSSDVNLALSVIEQVLRDNGRVLQDPPPRIGVALLDDSSVNLRVNPWVKVPDYLPAASEINKAILETFRARNIVIPFPQREVRMLGGTG